ncbi:hypothetical protein C5142_15760 [Rhodococcus sp. BGS-1C]|uniref:hypothetical protein n=1 Tax=unclassified Rhodococcus (in: high G+C Gram-positive bacteria) TaxID=192944 RepID=UPI003D1619A1
MNSPDLMSIAALGVMAVLAVIAMALSEAAFVLGASFAALVFIAARSLYILVRRRRRQHRATRAG